MAGGGAWGGGRVKEAQGTPPRHDATTHHARVGRPSLLCHHQLPITAKGEEGDDQSVRRLSSLSVARHQGRVNKWAWQPHTYPPQTPGLPRRPLCASILACLSPPTLRVSEEMY